MNAQIHIHFPQSGSWDDFLLTALWQDAEGYDCRHSYSPADIPAEQLAALQTVVASLVGLAEPWRATHVVAMAGSEADCLELSAEVQRDSDGATRLLTSAELPQLQLRDEAMRRIFLHLTHQD